MVARSSFVALNWKDDVRVVLFVQLPEGEPLTEELKRKIRTTIRDLASPRHVPAKIIAVPGIPYTLNMKKVEMAIKKVLDGKPVHHTLANHWARVIELLHASERIQELVNDPELTCTDIRNIPVHSPSVGIGAV